MNPNDTTKTVELSTVAKAGQDQTMVKLAGSPEGRSRMICKDDLSPASLASAKAEAETDAKELLSNSNSLFNYGNNELAGMNDLIDRLLRETESVDSALVNEIVTGMQDSLRTLHSKYDISNPEIRLKWEKFKGGFGRFFGKGKTLLEIIQEDLQKNSDYFDKLGIKVDDVMRSLEKGVARSEEMYALNGAEIDKVTYRIAVLELVRDIVAKQASTPDENGHTALGWEVENQAKLNDFLRNVDVKIGDLKDRLFTAWLQLPDIREVISSRSFTTMSVGTLKTTQIPEIKRAAVNIRTRIEISQAQGLSDTVRTSADIARRLDAKDKVGFAETMAGSRLKQGLAIDLMDELLAASLKQGEIILQAVKDERAKRLAADVKRAQSLELLASATGKINQEVLQELLDDSAGEAKIEIKASPFTVSK